MMFGIIHKAFLSHSRMAAIEHAKEGGDVVLLRNEPIDVTARGRRNAFSSFVY